MLITFKIFSYQHALIKTYTVQIILLPTITSELTPSATQFLKGLTKLAILPNFKNPGLLCLAFPPCQKFGLILLNSKKVLKFKLSKNHFNKRYTPKLLFFNEIDKVSENKEKSSLQLK